MAKRNKRMKPTKPTTAPEVQQTRDNLRVAQYERMYSSHPASGITPARAAVLLREAEHGQIYSQCELAEDMEERDAHLQSELGKRRRSLIGLSYSIKPPINASPQEQKDVEMLNELLDSFTWLEDCIYDATDAILKGFSCQEIVWNSSGGLMLPEVVEWVDPARFQTHPDERNLLTLRDGSYDGAELQQFGWIQHRAKSKSGYLARIGLIRTLVWPFIFKNYSARDLAEFLEIYGLPIRIGQYPSGASDAEKNKLLKAVMSIGHNAGGIIPAGMKIDFQNAADGGADPFMAMMSWAELSMSKAILGGTLTSQADGVTSTNALGNVHNEVRYEVRNSDAKQLAATLTRDLILPIYALNCSSFTNANRYPRFEFDLSEPEDVATYASALPPLAALGMRIPRAWAHEKLQIPEAADDEPILTPPAPAAPAFLNSQYSNKLATLNARHSVDPLAAVPGAITGEQWQNVVDPLLAPVINELITGNAESAKNKIAALYSEFDDEQLADMLHRAMFVAEAWGRLNA